MFIQNEQQISNTAENVMEATVAIIENGGYTRTGLDIARKHLQKSGIELPEATCAKLVEKQISLSSGDNGMDQGYIGQNTFEISGTLIQGQAPEMQLAKSPYNSILTAKNLTGVVYQQDIMESNYGYAQEAGSVGGINNVIPLLDVNGFTWQGQEYTETGEMFGNALIALRNPGSTAIEKANVIRRINMSQLNMLNRATMNIELTRIESMNKGSYVYKDVIYSSGVPSQNQGILSQSLGTYTVATNTFVPNVGITANAFNELASYVNLLLNTGYNPTEIIIDNVMYNAIIQSVPITDITRFITANSDNIPVDTQEQAFYVVGVPQLQHVKIKVYQQGLKTSRGDTTISNTRPIMWGKTIDENSFNALIKCENTGMSRVGELGFFPNQYKDTNIGLNTASTSSKLQNGSGIILAQQNLAQFDFNNQKIQWIVSTTIAPMIYLPEMIFPFNFDVTIV